MATASMESSASAREHRKLRREINAIKRAATSTGGRVALSRRSERLLSMLQSIYYPSMSGDNPSATQIRARLLLISMKRKQIRGQLIVLSLLAAAVMLISFFHTLPIIVFPVLLLVFILLPISGVISASHHAQAVKDIRARAMIARAGSETR